MIFSHILCGYQNINYGIQEQLVNVTYNTKIEYLASTTGNISGIYDINGGAWEYMASYVTGKVGPFKNYLDGDNASR